MVFLSAFAANINVTIRSQIMKHVSVPQVMISKFSLMRKVVAIGGQFHIMFIQHYTTYASRRSGDRRRREMLSSCIRRMVERLMVEKAMVA